MVNGTHHTWHLRLSRISLLASFSILIPVTIGLAFNIPQLYNWDAQGIPVSIKAISCFLFLLAGYGLQLMRRQTNRWLSAYVPTILYAGVLAVGLSELAAYLTANTSLTLEEFLSPEMPFNGHLSLYTVGGVLLGGIIPLLYLWGLRRIVFSAEIGQVLSLVLINIGAFGTVEHVGGEEVFRFLISLPGSLIFITYGTALLFSAPPAATDDAVPYFARPFLSNRTIRLYTLMVCMSWFAIVFWQGAWANAYLIPYDMTIDLVHSLVVLDELIEIAVSTIILTLGLHILATLDEQVSLAGRLRHTTGELQESLDSIAMLAGTLSHDLKGPIRAQINAIDMVQSGQYGERISDPDVQEVLAAVNDNNRFKLQLVLNLVDLLRFKIREDRFNPVFFSLPPFLDEVRRELEPMAAFKHQALVIRAEDLPPDTKIYADRITLKRVLHNLINNAIQHLGSDTRIEVATTFPNRHTVQFSVRDNGPGIPEALRDNLFNRFNRVSSSGLGLYIARQMVLRHGGEIWYDTSETGTVFYFTVPHPEPPAGFPAEPAKGGAPEPKPITRQ